MRSILLCLLLVMSSLCEAEDEATWSKPVNGLRGRLQVLAPPPSDPSFCRVFLELENTENVMGQRKVRFAADKLSLQVIDKDGRPLEVSHNPYDGFSTSWEPLLLPFGATIRFPVNMHGLAYRKDPPAIHHRHGSGELMDHPANRRLFSDGNPDDSKD